MLANHFLFLWQNYIELFIEYFKDDSGLPEAKRIEIIGFAKTKCSERQKAYDNCYLLHKAKVVTFKSLCNRKKFYNDWQKKFKESWMWNPKTKKKAPGLLFATKSFEHLITFSQVLNGLELLTPLVSRLQ